MSREKLEIGADAYEQDAEAREQAAYEEAVTAGFKGTIEEFRASRGVRMSQKPTWRPEGEDELPY